MEDSGDVSSKSKAQRCHKDTEYAESVMNLALSDPPRWGWTAAGTLADLLPPHERSRRRSSAVAYRKMKRKRSAAIASARTGKGETAAGQKASTAAPSSSIADNKPYNAENSGNKEDAGAKAASAPPPDNASAATLPMAPMMDKLHPPGKSDIEAKPTIFSESLSAGATKDGEVAKSSSEGKPVSKVTRLQPTPAVTSTNALSTDLIQQPQKKSSESSSNTAAEKMSQQTVPLSTAGPAASLPNPTDKLLGMKRSLLGMDVQRIDLQESEKAAKDSKTKSKRNAAYECRVEPLSRDIDVLDMYSYHRGREGFEARDPDTGELRCPLEATDTNYNYDAPRLILNVTIDFPLHDDRYAQRDSNDLPDFRETIQWDLSDPTTPSPLVFANNIAREFGLKYGQMLDLALNIQSQIDMHMQQNCSYSAPISTEDPNGMERTYMGPSIQTHRYGQVVQLVPGGNRMKPKERRVVTGGGRGSAPRVSVNGATSNAKRRSSVGGTKSDRDSLGEDIDESYIEEVKRRSRAESTRDVAIKCKNGTSGLMERHEDFQCHSCHKRCKTVFTFACGTHGHGYCESHCKSKLGGSFDSDRPVCSFCPICSLNCSCSKCARKLKAVAWDFKHATESQGAALQDAQFEDILGKCRTASSTIPPKSLSGNKRRNSEMTADGATPSSRSSSSKANARQKRVSTGRAEDRTKLLVPKPPLSEFPREIYGSLELEPGTPEDYLRVHSWNGTFLSDAFPEVWSEQEVAGGPNIEGVPNWNGELVEDGNVDFCQVCRNHGNLLCCDYCPRAFHVDCIEDDVQAMSSERWECGTCKMEKQELPEDLVDVKQSVDLICASFSDTKIDIDPNSSELEALSGIHSMLIRLMEYDFGYMFAVPVDAEAIPGYTETIKNPMDLGTICTKLTSGKYSDIIESGGTLEDVVITALQDVELVWHNCLTFNFDGSAIHRMAVVQKRRALAIQKKSFDHLLSDRVKTAISEYVRSCEVTRGQLSSTLPGVSNPVSSAKERELRLRRPKGKHKITVKLAKPSVNRPVAIFDQVTGRVVKIYSSMKSAGHAAHSLFSLGHRCEWAPTQDLVKQVVGKSLSDPSVTLFGYRWLMLDELRAGKVAFHEPPMEGIQVRHGDSTHTFLSVDEASSFPLLEKNLTVEQVRRQLLSLEKGGEWTSIGGRMWRVLGAPGQGTRTEKTSAPDKSKYMDVEEIPEEIPTLLDKEFLGACAVVKEDLITKRKLVGFETVQAAFVDWKVTATSSPSFPLLEAKTMENFKRYYLCAERNIDGLVWRGQNSSILNSVNDSEGKTRAPVAIINGVAPSPLVRSAAKNRSGSNKGVAKNSREESTNSVTWTNTLEDDGRLLMEQSSNICPKGGDEINDTPLMGIQLFKRPMESETMSKRKHGEVSQETTSAAS